MQNRLKSLEMQGYKTFATRNVFEFSGAITAIVGPNGSGKSNIVDGLRWVLGEQSYSLLRGKRTEDMIFSGSEQRPRAGMASVSVVLENEDGWLPIDFTEVAITRRAYRDGQNEYLINGQRVRLRDVSELLAQSGLAQRTYTIIGQGLVDAALSLRADERRRLFEEAAGIGLHRSRREEALRRLESTRRNLERVQDILAELQPRLRSLERQARRSQEYEQVKADLQIVLREWYGYHWHRAQRELVEAQEAANQQDNQLESSRLSQSELALQVASMRDRLQAVRASLNSWHRQLAQIHDQREKLGRELAVAEERKRLLIEQRSNEERELLRLDEELALFQERVALISQEVERQQNEQMEAQKQLETAFQALSARQAERETVARDIQEARQQLTTAQDRLTQLQARLLEQRAVINRQQQELEDAQRALQAAQEEVSVARQQLAAAKSDHQDEQRKLSEIEVSLQEHESKVAEIESLRQSSSETMAGHRSEAARLRARQEVLEQAEKALVGYAEGARLLLQAAQQERLQGAVGALSAQLDVPADFERAVSAALGEYLDAVLLSVEANSDQALDLLSEKTLRAMLLPLSNLKPADPLQPPSHPGCLGVAWQLVRAPAQIQPAVDLLLGQVLVVSDRATARQLLAGQAAPLRAVTLKGEVFYASGAVQAGTASDSTESSSILSRPRQRREISESLAKTERLVIETQARLDTLNRAQVQLKNFGQELAQQLRGARQKESEARAAFQGAQLAVEGLERQLGWRQDQSKRLEGEISLGEGQVQATVQEIENAEAGIQSLQELLRQVQHSLSDLPVEDLQSQAAHWNTRQAVAERALSEVKLRQQEAQAALERVESNRKTIQDRLDNLVSEQEILGIDQEQHRSREAELSAQTEAFQDLIQPAEQELAELESSVDTSQTKEGQARQALSAAEHRYAQARIRLNHYQEALTSLRRRIEDDFGLVAFDYADEITGPSPLPLDGMVEHLPVVKELSPELEESLKRRRSQIRRMGAINPDAQREYNEVKERVDFLTSQVADLEKAERDIRQVISELDELMQREFHKTFEAVAVEFRKIFTRLFGGGSARLILTDPDDLTNTGIDIEARLPGRRTQGLSLLSGGERSLTAAALVFALLRTSPTPFCILDEVDAMLDEANVSRFRELLRELSEKTQFVIITHNRNTVQVADVIYGVTMGRDSISQTLSLRLDEVSDLTR